MIARLGIALVALSAAMLQAPSLALASRDDPEVRLIEPDRGERRFVAPATVVIEAKAHATRGRRIARVEFFADGKPIGQANAAPYEITWRNVALGHYTVRAKATDNRGASDWSAPIKVHVHRNHEPDVSLVEPDRGDKFKAPAKIRFEARARDRDHNLARVEFYANGQLVGQATRAPWRFTWNALQPGDYLLHAKAIDAQGASDESRKVPIRVVGNALPTVSLTSPANGATFTAPATIPLAANASDPMGAGGGGVVRVEFYADDTLIATDLNEPYVATWNGVSPGSYTLRARAVDTAGAEAFSAPVSITVIPGGPQGYFIHVDHLNTPRLVANQQGQTVWRWDQQEPFGASAPDENPSGLGTFEFPLRMPGQYFDKETNLHYNYFRDYDPRVGRYIQSDPIGLAGGINTYAYVHGRPISLTDPLGLDYAFYVDPAAAGGNGHTTLYFQNENGAWFTYDQGAAGATSSGGGNIGYLLGLNAPAGVSIQPVAAPPPGSLVYPSTAAQNAAITRCAVGSGTAHNSGATQYNLYSNNCTDAAVDVLACAGITVPNPVFTVRPNSWVQQLPPPPAPNTPVE